MLLEVKEHIQIDWDIYLAGWNNNPDVPTVAEPDKKIHRVPSSGR